MADLKPGLEAVHTFTDHYDKPRKGIADFESWPHLYECIFDEQALLEGVLRPRQLQWSTA